MSTEQLGFQVVGEFIYASETELPLSDAEKLRDVGRRVMFSEASSTGVYDEELQSVILAPRPAGAQHDPAVKDIYVAALDFQGDDIWKSRLRYHSYERGVDTHDLIVECAVEVYGEDVMTARRSIYRTRHTERLYPTGRGLQLDKFDRRTMAETPLLPSHIDTIEKRVERLIKRAEV